MARWNGAKVADVVVTGIRAKRPPPEIIAELVELGIASPADADTFWHAVELVFSFFSSRVGKPVAPTELEQHLRENELPKKLLTAAMKVAEGLSSRPAAETEGRAITIDVVVDCLVAALREGLEPPHIVARLVALELPPDLAQLQVNTIGRALTVASGAYTVTLDEFFAELSEHVQERGFPEPVARATARVLARLHGAESADEGPDGS